MDNLQKIVDLQNQVTSIDQAANGRGGVFIVLAFIGVVAICFASFAGDDDKTLRGLLGIIGLGLIALIAIPITYQVGHQHSYDNMQATIDVLKLGMVGK